MTNPTSYKAPHSDKAEFDFECLEGCDEGCGECDGGFARSVDCWICTDPLEVGVDPIGLLAELRPHPVSGKVYPHNEKPVCGTCFDRELPRPMGVPAQDELTPGELGCIAARDDNAAALEIK